MCYDYETLIRRGIKRSIHEQGYETTMNSLTEREKYILTNAGAYSGAGESKATDEEAEKQSTYPGAEVQVILITTKQREFYYFGFLPDWATSFNDYRKNFNARADSLRIKPTWKKAWKNNQRCLICAAGFYEKDRQTKNRYFFSVTGKDEIFFAGIYNHWLDKSTGEMVKTFAIITTEPNKLVLPVHDRMPVILDKEGELIWLKPQTSEETVFNLLQPYPAELMEMKEAPAPPRKKKSTGPELDLGL
jgi:putative SOS response-associated peptidase YedK